MGAKDLAESFFDESNIDSCETVGKTNGSSDTSFSTPPIKSQKQKEFPKVAILLCTYYAQNYLAEQLESIAAQTYPNWEVWTSDDGSQDDTHTILEAYKRNWKAGRLSVQSGPGQGFAHNFLALSCNESIDAEYYAYSDQDDIWELDKLQRAITLLETVPHNIPALYCTRTRLINSENSHIGFSPLFTKRPCFANALMQNIGGGNTMVFNKAARELLQNAGEKIGVVTHDWWLYIVVSGCGGKVFYDPYPSVRYRQHSSNLVGMNSSWPARFARLRMLLEGRFREWNNSNINAIQRLRFNLTLENTVILDRFSNARNSSLITRLIGLKKSGIYRQTMMGNFGLVVAAVFKKI